MQVHIPGYHIKKVLGKGGMATVYLAVQEIFEREVALKVMSPALAEDPSFGQRFMREARIVSQLVHPHIITVYDVGLHESYYYLSMEYIPGPDVKQACTQLSLIEKLAVIEDVARALDFAGNKGYVHRDIKPENILLRSATSNAVLMDFGIARAAETDLSMTQTGTSLGTPHYMSPEQAKGQGVDHRSDLYSLGVVFYFMLMQSVPYKADSAVAIGIKHITEPVPVLPGYLQMLNGFIARLMAKEPEHRYQHAADFIADLQRLDHKKLLKQYAQKAKYKAAPTPESLDPEPTMIHGAATRIDRAISFASADLPPQLMPPGVGKKRWQIAGGSIAAVLLLAAVAGVASRQLSSDDATAVAPATESSAAEGEAGAFGPVKAEAEQPLSEKLGDGLSHLTSRLGRQKVDVSGQVRQLREQIERGAEPSQARAKLDQLAQQQLTALSALFDKGEYEQAQSQLKKLARLFPEYAEQLREYQQRIPQRELLATYAQKAQQRMDQGQYLQPDDDSAEHYYMAILELAPDAAVAHKGLVEMAKRTIAKANQQFAEGNWQAAQEVIDRLLELDPNHIASLKLQRKIDDYKKIEPDIHQHLSRAQGHLSAGNLYSPEGNNAYSHFQQALTLHKGHRRALEGLEQVHQALEKKLFAMVERQDASLAQETLAQVKRVRGQDDRLAKLEQELVALIEQRQDRQNPAVKRVIVAAEPFSAMATQAADALQPKRTLYIGLEYQAFAEDGALMQAVLYGPRGQAEANVPVTVEQSQGTHFFRIDRARENFDDGQYQLKLVMDGQTLAEADFWVR